jgi:uncharacterized protein
MLELGKVETVAISLSHAGHQIASGNALCLLVAGGNFPLLDPNPHGEGPIADQVTNRPAMQMVHHGGGYGSSLRLPVLDIDT